MTTQTGGMQRMSALIQTPAKHQTTQLDNFQFLGSCSSSLTTLKSASQAKAESKARATQWSRANANFTEKNILGSSWYKVN